LLPKQKTHGFALKDPTFPPLGMLYMGSMLEQQGHTVELIDFQFESHPLKKVHGLLPSVDLVGINVDNLCRDVQKVIAAQVKQMDPSIPLVIGGPYCTVREKYSMQFIPQADICVVGEGEYAIVDIVNALLGKKKLSSIPGVFYRENNHIKTGKPVEIIKDLNKLPFPARHLVDKYKYGKIGKTYMYQPRVTLILTSRGCAFRCRFCIRHVLTYKSFRQRSAQNVLNELLELNEHYGSVMIIDDNFLTDTKRAHDIMDQLIEHKTTIDLSIAGSRVDTADASLFKKMKKAGLKHIQFGIEAGTQKVLDFYGKKTTIDQITKAVKLAHEQDFFITGSFIVGAPIETETDIKKTIEYACSLPLDIVVYNPLDYKYGSDLWLDANQAGLIQDDEHNVFADSRRGIGHFTKEELEQFCRDALKKFYFRPSYIFHQTRKAIRTRDFRIINTWLNYI
jgi:anaerobic magnesium-protoporphyrin IX monomethyl ester cyclase